MFLHFFFVFFYNLRLGSEERSSCFSRLSERLIRRVDIRNARPRNFITFDWKNQPAGLSGLKSLQFQKLSVRFRFAQTAARLTTTTGKPIICLPNVSILARHNWPISFPLSLSPSLSSDSENIHFYRFPISIEIFQAPITSIERNTAIYFFFPSFSFLSSDTNSR